MVNDVEPQTKDRKYLVTGASGYVGGRLVRDLVSDKCAVRVLVRDAQKVADQPWAKDVDIVEGNATVVADLDRALKGVHTAFYLLHSINLGKNFDDIESEMARNFAERFNHRYGETFPLPYAFNYNSELVNILGLDGEGKMSKSENQMTTLFLAETDDLIRKKVMKAVTDAGPTEPNQEKPAIIQNLFDIMKAVSPASNYEHFDELYNNQQIRYGDFKKQLAEDIIVFTSPIREKILEIGANNDYLKKVAKNGADKARESASKTIKEVREIIGFKSF